MTLQQIQELILDNIHQRDLLAQEAAAVYRDEAEADHAYELAHARAYLSIREGTVESRKAEAALTVGDQKLKKRLAEAKAQSTKDRLRAYESTISALQSLLKLQVLDYETAKYGTYSK